MGFVPFLCRLASRSTLLFIMACTNGGLVGEGLVGEGRDAQGQTDVADNTDATVDVETADTAVIDAGGDAPNGSSDASNDNVVRGTFHTGTFAETSVQLALEWGVVSIGADYAIVEPAGIVDESTFEFALPSEAPMDGLNTNPGGRSSFGVAFFLAYPTSYSVPRGRVSGGDGFSVNADDAVGIVPQAIIVRQGSDADIEREWSPTLHWLLDFPVGVSCGAGVFLADVFDRFEPVDCRSLDLFGVAAPGLQVPDWS